MKDTLDRRPRLLTWRENGFATAPDGTLYAIFDDWSRGEPRIYWPAITTPDEFGAPQGWTKVAPASRKRETAMNAGERHAREHHAAVAS